MLVQSSETEIRLLPALPASWPKGQLRGVRVRGGVELNMSWSEGRVDWVRVTASTARDVTIRAGRPVVLSLPAGIAEMHDFTLEQEHHAIS